MASEVGENGGGTLEGAVGGAVTYSEVLQGTVKIDSKPIFLKESDLFGKVKPTKEQFLTNAEMYKTLAKDIPVEAILGIQRVGSLWRLYIEDIANRVLLLAKGVSLRGKTIQLYEKNPFTPDRSGQVRVRVKNIPLSADDSIIVKALKDAGCELVENPSREKLRIDGKLTNCETGDRIVFIKPPKEPLPKVMKMDMFRAVIVHPGQIVNTRKQVCGKCLQDNHRTSDCMNDWVCNRCMISGHKSGDCPMTSVDTHQNEDDIRPEPDTVKTVEIQSATRSNLIGELTMAGPAPHSSPREHKKADRKLKQDRPPTGIIAKSIQDYFITSDKTPLKDKQKPTVRHSPPTPIEEQKSQKKTKMRGDDSSENSGSESNDE